MAVQMCTTFHTNCKISIRRDGPNIVHIGFSRKGSYQYISLTNNEVKRIVTKLSKFEK